MSLINQLYKISGIIKYSKPLKDKIINFIIDQFEIIKKENLKDFLTYKYFKLNKEDFAYKIPEEKLNLIKDLLVTINFYDSSKQTKNEGEFNSNKMQLTINIPVSNRHRLNYNNVESTLEHELIHLTQFILKQNIQSNKNIDEMYIKFYEYAEKNNIDIESLSDKDRESLLRKFKAENNFDPTDYFVGFPKEFDNKKYNELVKDEFGYIDHDQLPHEFFSVLNDVLNEFKKKNDGSREFFNNFIRGINASESTKKFLYKIKYNKDLYNRFLKEIYKISNL